MSLHLQQKLAEKMSFIDWLNRVIELEVVCNKIGWVRIEMEIQISKECDENIKRCGADECRECQRKNRWGTASESGSAGIVRSKYYRGIN